MEVTTVSPSPASPTEGDKLCEIDVTNMAIHSVTLLICLCGLLGNGAVIWLYSLESRTYAIFDVSVADFLFLLLTVPSALLLLVEDMSCSPTVPLIYLNFLFHLSMVSFYWGTYRLVHSSNAVGLSALLQLCCCCHLPMRLWWVVDSVQYWTLFVLFTVIPRVTSLCPSQEGDHCRAAFISIYNIILFLFAAPVIIFCTINIIKVRCGSKKKHLNRRLIVVFIVLLFTFLFIFCNFLQQLGYMHMSSEVFFLLTCINSSIKPFICFLAGSCWSPCSMGSLQLSLKRVFVEKKEKPSCSDYANTDTVI